MSHSAAPFWDAADNGSVRLFPLALPPLGLLGCGFLGGLSSAAPAHLPIMEPLKGTASRGPEPRTIHLERVAPGLPKLWRFLDLCLSKAAAGSLRPDRASNGSRGDSCWLGLGDSSFPRSPLRRGHSAVPSRHLLCITRRAKGNVGTRTGCRSRGSGQGVLTGKWSSPNNRPSEGCDPQARRWHVPPALEAASRVIRFPASGWKRQARSNDLTP